jgi:hypothetical protein
METNNINEIKYLDTFFYIMSRCLMNDKASYNELLIEEIMWAISQEFSHYKSDTLIKLFNEYVKLKKSYPTKIVTKMKCFILEATSTKLVNKLYNDESCKTIPA